MWYVDTWVLALRAPLAQETEESASHHGGLRTENNRRIRIGEMGCSREAQEFEFRYGSNLCEDLRMKRYDASCY